MEVREWPQTYALDRAATGIAIYTASNDGILCIRNDAGETLTVYGYYPAVHLKTGEKQVRPASLIESRRAQAV